MITSLFSFSQVITFIQMALLISGLPSLTSVPRPCPELHASSYYNVDNPSVTVIFLLFPVPPLIFMLRWHHDTMPPRAMVAAPVIYIRPYPAILKTNVWRKMFFSIFWNYIVFVFGYSAKLASIPVLSCLVQLIFNYRVIINCRQ
jgi:hypothetical protein